MKRLPRPAFAVAALLWAVLVGSGGWVLVRYQYRAGDAGSPRQVWPVDSGLELSRRVPTLVMLAHPRCPCTRASIQELAQLMARVPSQVSAYVLFLAPRDEKQEWMKTDLWAEAERIPGVRVVSDSDGREAGRLGVKTSGHALLFDTTGRLLFDGGITDSRGHSGDSTGGRTIAALLEGGIAPGGKTPVFGCSLFGAES